MLANTILNAATLVLLGAGWLWLRHVVNQRLKLKDEQIKTLQARIDHAKEMAAPNIVADLKEVSGYANSIAGRNRELRGMVHQINEELKNMKENQTREYLIGLRGGFMEGAATMQLTIDKCIKGDVDSNEVEDLKGFVINLIDAMVKAHSSLVAKAGMTIRGEIPKLDQTNALVLLLASEQGDK